MKEVKELCFWCGEPKGTVEIPDALTDSPFICRDYEPCPACETLFQRGIVVIEANEEPSLEGQPMLGEGYPTGMFVVMEREAFEGHEEILSAGKVMLDPPTWDALALPREVTDNTGAQDDERAE